MNEVCMCRYELELLPFNLHVVKGLQDVCSGLHHCSAKEYPIHQTLRTYINEYQQLNTTVRAFSRVSVLLCQELLPLLEREALSVKDRC